MGLWDTSDQLGKEAEAKRIEKKREEEIAERSKAEAADEAKRHEENKRQGMI
jgi:hypothetical protein